MPDILDETLSEMTAMRKSIAFRFWWFYHVTPIGNADGVRQKGIITNQDKAAPSQALKYVGADAGKIICLNPLGTKCVPGAVQDGPYICLALSMETLPHKIGLDWSYDGAVGIAQTLRDQEPSRPAHDIFLEAIYRWGSIVSYEPIRPDGLRVCCKGCLPHDPSRWPTLVSAPNDMLMQF